MLSISCHDISTKVRKLVRRYKTSDPSELCSCMDIILCEADFGSSETAIKAMTMTVSRVSCIQYSSALPDTVRRFIIAHELGHAVLHRKNHIDTGFFDDISVTEREANLFAAELLFGSSDILYEKMKNSEGSLFQFAAEYNVPYELLAYKIEIMKDEGYDVPELPYRPDSRFLGGRLWNENCCSCG
ncbi:ImmA/IrrE family metallo-endopeptidase [Ruminococcus sp. HUN007]|uniref:ImmA/IrrE family metallo-endopeptidase n=1 Tax=Ruminococcus sp. HUN007 TaxID=1514668 RepID=UPI0005D2AAAA|nr:ImmA/IrrE family metallo-endopeptidase [Ruminococcus sp. HUN007]